MTTRIGSQDPTYLWAPLALNTGAAEEAIALYGLTGRTLDPWQQTLIRAGLGEREDGSPAVFQALVVVGRQNGKGDVIETLELNWLFLPQPRAVRLITHSAHQFDTSREAFRRMISAIESVPDFDAQVARIARTHGEEGIELRDGRRLQYRTRSGTGGGGRGFTGDKLVLDESMILGGESIAALLPTLATKRDAQVWYFGSAGSRKLPTASKQMARVRRQGLKKAPRVMLAEWSAPDDVDVEDRDWWYRTNPGLGIRITEEYIADELAALGDTFARERLGVGDYPSPDGWMLFDQTVWANRCDPNSVPVGKVALAVDVNVERSRASVAIAGVNADGRWHCEWIQGRSGTSWVPEYVKGVKSRQRLSCVVIAPSSPARTLIRELEELKIRVYQPKETQVLTWCAAWYDGVVDSAMVVHRGQEVLTTAVGSARQQTVGDGFKWSRKDPKADITPLWAVTLALGGHLVHSVKRTPLVTSA